MHKCGLSRHAVSVRPSVRPSVTFVDHVKTNKRIFEICTPSGSHTILVFPYQMGWRYSDDITGVLKIWDLRPLLGYISELMQDRAIVTMEGE